MSAQEKLRQQWPAAIREAREIGRQLHGLKYGRVRQGEALRRAAMDALNEAHYCSLEYDRANALRLPTRPRREKPLERLHD